MSYWIAVFDNEIALAKELIAAGELGASFSHLERAHIIGQALVVPHVISHTISFSPLIRFVSWPELGRLINSRPH